MTVLLLTVLITEFSPPRSVRGEESVPLSSLQGEAVIDDGKHISLHMQSPPDSSVICGTLPADRFLDQQKKQYRIPFEHLCPQIQLQILRTLFPEDNLDDKGWHHLVSYSGTVKGGENLFRIALWFTGSGANHRDLLKSNPHAQKAVKIGMTITIPLTLLSSGLREALAAEKASIREDRNGEDLTYMTDKTERHAVYRLKKGEALYSSVVMRFTGRVLAQDVNELAMILARKSNITDVTNIPIGFPVKIPVEYLAPEYLPHDDPLYRDYVKNRQASQQYARSISARDLERVIVVIDTGHGGKDPGALGYYQVVEDEYVYDIACRIRKVLLEQTRCRVIFTNYDPV